MRLRPLAWVPFLPALMVFGWQFVLGCVIWRYHGAAFLSLMLNAFIAAVLIEFACRLFARRKS